MVSPMELLDRSIAFLSKRPTKKRSTRDGSGGSLKWVLAILVGSFVFLFLFVKSDAFGGLMATLLVILVGVFGLLFYFLPTIKAYQDNKANKQAILVLNLLLGWTLIGWVVALVWAYTKGATAPVVVAVPSATGVPSPAVLCSACGKYSPSASMFCPHCGGRLA